MSNQTFSNNKRRYFPLKKENVYTQTNNISIPHDTNTLFTYETLEINEIGSGLTYNSGKFTIVNEDAEGLYTFDSVITWDFDRSNERLTWFVKNNERVRRGFNFHNPNVTGVGSQFVGVNTTSITINMRVGDELFFFVNQNADTLMPLDITGTNFNSNVFSQLVISLLQ